jgi:uncharacterized protein
VSLPIEIPESAIKVFCERWNVAELSLFGSVLGEGFRSDSDIDFLVTPADDARWSLFDLMEMEAELRDLFGRPVDLVNRRGVERSSNAIRKRQILQSAVRIYAAA